jgi:5-methylcytosine-specific restriction protein A
MPTAPKTFRPAHAQKAKRDYETSEERQADKRFYASAAWRRFRKWVLQREPLCRRCKAEGRDEAAEHVHHVKSRKTHPDLAFNESNVEPLCEPHHSAEEMARRNGRQ